MKTVNVEDATWTRLTILKAIMVVESMDDVVVKLLDVGESKIRDEIPKQNNLR